MIRNCAFCDSENGVVLTAYYNCGDGCCEDIFPICVQCEPYATEHGYQILEYKGDDND